MNSKRFFRGSIAAVMLSAVVTSCAAEGPRAPRDGLYSPAVQEVVVEVDYQRGAEPYTEAGLTTGSPWELLRRNAEALFEGAPRRLTIPARLGEMQALDGVTGQDFSSSAILQLAARHRDQYNSATRRTFYVLFLDGYFHHAGARQTGVLGVSLGDTGVIAIFKPVIRRAGSGVGTTLQRHVEQATLVHEFGHAVGLVDNGVAMAHPHRDPDHGAHCNNRDCVMYWRNEGLSDMVEFVTRRVLSGREVLFDADCLRDVHEATEQSRPAAE